MNVYAVTCKSSHRVMCVYSTKALADEFIERSGTAEQYDVKKHRVYEVAFEGDQPPEPEPVAPRATRNIRI